MEYVLHVILILLLAYIGIRTVLPRNTRRKLLAFIKRDFKLEMSYRLSFFFTLFSMFVSIGTFFLVGHFVWSDKLKTQLASYGGNYFAFVLIGIAFSSYLGVGMNSVTSAIRREQSMGTLEIILLSPTRLPIIIVASSLWQFIRTSFNVFLYLIIGALIFKVDMGNANIGVGILVLFLTIIVYTGFGILSAAFTIVFKRGNPINWLFGSLAGLLGGTYFDPQILEKYPLLKNLSDLLPVTYSLRAMRKALLTGAGFNELSGDIKILLLFAIILIPIGLPCFRYALRWAKKDGSLVHY